MNRALATLPLHAVVIVLCLSTLVNLVPRISLLCLPWSLEELGTKLLPSNSILRR